MLGRKFLSALLLWVVGAAFQSGIALAAPEVTGLRHGVQGDQVRLTWTVSEEPAFAAFTLTDPDRLVLDFPELAWSVPATAWEGVPYIQNVRHGLFRADRARVVIDLSQPVSLDRIFTQAPQGSEPGRLVLDLSPVDRATFNSRAGAPEQARWQSAPSAPPAAEAGDIIIALDPGHGGIDPGARHGGVAEKTIVLNFAKVLAAEIDRKPGFAAYLTRDRDVFVPLGERVARAQRSGAHVLLSIHADTVEAGRARGMSIYRLSDVGTDAAAEALAARENRSDILAGADLDGESDDLTRVLVELAQRGTQDESGKLATALLGALQGNLRLLRTRPLRQANFRVLKAPDLPSVLLELGFLNSDEDRAHLIDPAWQAKAAGYVVKGLEAWRDVASPGFLTPR